MPTFYEFFSGGGMARAGLGAGWTCLFANDFDPKKGIAYQSNWGAGGELKIGDVRDLSLGDLPGRADLVWGSFPCQDMSLAGAGAGLSGGRSSAFYPFWELIRGLVGEGRAPEVIALENVCGTITSHEGRDFEAIYRTFVETGYRVGALVIDAELFVPQSRPRLFVIGVRDDVEIAPTLLASAPTPPFHTRGLCDATARLPMALKAKHLWWRLPTPDPRRDTFADIVEERPADVAWHTPQETAQLLAKMSPVHLAKLDAAKRARRRVVGCVYKRTRTDAGGQKAQRAEVRFDGVAGCLRTPAGGSSRQVILMVDGGRVRSRLISARETARLMGLPDDYRLPTTYNEAYHLTGDGVVVPVVAHLAQHLFEPIVASNAKSVALKKRSMSVL